MSEPVIGMIVPPAAGEVPPEALALYPSGIRFAARGLALKALTVEDYGIAIKRVRDLARALCQEEGAQAISLMGTSLSFFQGGTFNEELVNIITSETGLPATTMSNSIRDALRTVGARRIAVGTAYTEEVNARLRQFLEGSGFDVVSLVGLDLVEIADIQAVTPGQVSDLARRAARAAPDADATFVSCGGLPAVHLANDVEPDIGMPVIASSTAGVWGAVRLIGEAGDVPALGALGRASRPVESPVD